MRRVIAKVEWHPGELYPRVGFIVTNMSRPAERVVASRAIMAHPTGESESDESESDVDLRTHVRRFHANFSYQAGTSRNPIYRTRWSRGVLAVPTGACCPRLELATKVGLRNSVHATQGVAAS